MDKNSPTVVVVREIVFYSKHLRTNFNITIQICKISRTLFSAAEAIRSYIPE